ncbi:MAG: tetratricopeptide repeat protein [Bacteroidales bacterium]|nr:tetratricopeptide repeat protein [Bacteroidales bacterium]
MRRILSFIIVCLTLCSFSIDKVEAVLERAYAAEDSQRFEEAIGIYEQALAMLPEDSVVWISDINSSLLICHVRLGQIQKGLACGEVSLRLDEQMGDKERISSSLNNLSSALITAGRLALAESYLQRSIAIERERKADDKLAVRLGMLAELYTKMERPDKALPMAKEALELDEKGGREAKAAIRMSQYGSALVSTKRSAEALPYLRRALTLHRKYENFTSEAITLATLGIAENALHHPAEAEGYLNQCVELSQRIGVVQPLMTAHMELSRIYDAMGDHRAYGHLLEYNALKDSIASVQVQQQISDLEVKYETKEKEQELRHKEVLIQRQRILDAVLGIMLLLVLAVVVGLVKMLRLKNQNMALKDRLMQIVSHDLKNPAIAHQKALHVLSKSVGVLSTDEVRTMTQSMAEDADAHVNLLYSLLDWAGLQTGRLRYTPVTLTLVAACEEVIAQHRAQATIKGVTLTITADDADHTVVADRQMVEAMVRNLLSNAIKFSPAGCEVRVTIEGVTVMIIDNGVGLGAESTEKGTGLGLNLVRKLADINKATFSITKNEGCGTTAVLKF